MLRVSRLSVFYGRHRALHEISLDVSPGEIVAILGANGAGKSSLLKAIAGLVRPAVGSEIGLGTSVITNVTPNEIVEIGIALVPEGRAIFRDLTVAENLALGAYARRARASEAQHLSGVFELFPRLKERRRQIARTMSGGEQQMLAIGRALMSNPSILMLDEPSLGLSPLLCDELFKAIERIRGQRVGILLVEQNAVRSLEIANRGYLLENGRVTGSGEAADLQANKNVQRAYLGATGDA